MKFEIKLREPWGNLGANALLETYEATMWVGGTLWGNLRRCLATKLWESWSNLVGTLGNLWGKVMETLWEPWSKAVGTLGQP